jgi:hypothetical protein
MQVDDRVQTALALLKTDDPKTVLQSLCQAVLDDAAKIAENAYFTNDDGSTPMSPQEIANLIRGGQR